MLDINILSHNVFCTKFVHMTSLKQIHLTVTITPLSNDEVAGSTAIPRQFCTQFSRSRLQGDKPKTKLNLGVGPVIRTLQVRLFVGRCWIIIWMDDHPNKRSTQPGQPNRKSNSKPVDYNYNNYNYNKNLYSATRIQH